MARRKKKNPGLKDRLVAWMEQFDRATIRRGALGLLWTVGLAGVVWATWLGVPRLEAFAAETVTQDQIEVRFVAPPAWIEGDLGAWLSLTAKEAISRHPLRRDELVAIRQALLATGCFESVTQVRRLSAQLIEVQAVFLHPFAVVRDRDGEHLVDSRGRLLPPGYRLGPNRHFIRIVGLRFDRPPRAGLAWDGTDLQAALRLVRAALSRPWWGQIHAINVTELERITMNTSRGCRIIWGSPLDEEVVGEAVGAEKIMRLDYLDANFGRLDVDCLHELDITDPHVVTAR